MYRAGEYIIVNRLYRAGVYIIVYRVYRAGVYIVVYKGIGQVYILLYIERIIVYRVYYCIHGV